MLKLCKLIVYFSRFWKLKDDQDKFTNRMMNLNVMSYFATQNIECTKLILWKLAFFPVTLEKRIVRILTVEEFYSGSLTMSIFLALEQIIKATRTSSFLKTIK